ncbi:GH92 family glycosyl hydrolase [Streptomyces sp. NBC_01267]|uniref:GH92 family glycosyl hydrolase n=1 Tax=Streptomyces sp. NBC_01267 TaxID=2903805 RepID=UPI002E373313|nr:GH92 family glycosyl hydrolase [Streptomyces sp. NBC_01267]
MHLVRPGLSGASSRHRLPRSAPLAWAVVLVIALVALFTPPFAATSRAARTVSSATGRAAHTVSNVGLVDPLIGTTGGSSTEYGGMIPSTAPPFGMTRWSPMTRDNSVGRTPYHHDDTKITGFIGTHQPAIWMGDSGYVVGMPGVGAVKTATAERGLAFSHADETTSPALYTVNMQAGAGQTLRTEMTGTSRVGFLRMTYPHGADPNFVLQATRSGITGQVHVDPGAREITGYNPDRQDKNLGPFKASNFKGYFVARFDTPFTGHGTATGATQYEGQADRTDADLSAYVRFPTGTRTVQVRIATSFISVDQARANLTAEVPDDQTFEQTVGKTRAQWSDKLDRVDLQGSTPDQSAVFYTAMYHALQYPSEMSEHGRYYSAYDDKVHSGVSYTGYSTWDTYRAENAFLTLFAPERINGMVTSMLQDYQQGGWLPMWKNMTETNIMVGTNADSMIAEDMAKGFSGFDRELAYEAVRKDAMTPPDRDTELDFHDREQGTPVEARAGLTTYKQNGWVAADHTSEAGSRTLDYAYEDWAVAQIAKKLGKTDDAKFFLERSNNYKKLFNPATGFMQARNLDGSWANGGWSEGDQWVYTTDVMHDIPGLIDLKGGKEKFASWLDSYFAGGHNNHTNEPSHHAAYLYDFAGQPWKTQEQVRRIAHDNYANSADGLSGNEDCGQMSAWYVLSSLGIYPANPASGQYTVGSPFFDKAVLHLPATSRPLVISAPGAATKPYVQSLSLNGRKITKPFLNHADLVHGGNLKFTMNSAPQAWAATSTPPAADPDLAFGKPVTMINGTSAFGWGKPVEDAVDNDPSTMAQSKDSAPWSLKVDLGAATSVGRMVVDPDWENYPKTYSLKVSTDGENWTTVAAEADSGGTTGCADKGVTTCGQTHAYSFAPVNARYVLLDVTDWTNAKTGTRPTEGWGWALDELEVYDR